MNKSFSTITKEEICKTDEINGENQKVLFGFVLICAANFQAGEISIKISNEIFFEWGKKFIDEVTNLSYKIINKNSKYTISFHDALSVAKIKNYLSKVFSFNPIRGSINKAVNKFSRYQKRLIMMAAFLVAGSIADPKLNYQIEIIIRRKFVNRFFADIIDSMDINFIQANYNNTYEVIYIKNSEDIAEFLAQLGANKSYLEFENIRVKKKVNEQVNRAINCDNANIKKIANSSARQINLINKLNAVDAYNNLPRDLREIADARLENPGLSLIELGNELSPSIGKSGVYHRLSKLEKWIEEYLSKYE